MSRPVYRFRTDEGFLFGGPRDGLRVTDWDAGGFKWGSVEASDSRLVFGQDLLSPPTWRLGLRAMGSSEVGSRGLVRDFMSAWQPGSFAPGVVGWLAFELDGRWRRVFGRPGDVVVPAVDPFSPSGRLVFSAEWRCLDGFVYDDTVSRVGVAVAQPLAGGFMFPQAPPFTWGVAAPSTVSRAVVGGDVPAPLRIIVRGPVSRPWVRVGPVVVQFDGDLAWDEEVTVDGLSRLCLFSAGRSGSAAHLLDPRVRLADLRVPPGVYDVSFGGSDRSGSANVTVEWRNAYQSL